MRLVIEKLDRSVSTAYRVGLRTEVAVFYQRQLIWSHIGNEIWLNGDNDLGLIVEKIDQGLWHDVTGRKEVQHHDGEKPIQE